MCPFWKQTAFVWWFTGAYFCKGSRPIINWFLYLYKHSHCGVTPTNAFSCWQNNVTAVSWWFFKKRNLIKGGIGNILEIKLAVAKEATALQLPPFLFRSVALTCPSPFWLFILFVVTKDIPYKRWYHTTYCASGVKLYTFPVTCCLVWKQEYVTMTESGLKQI